MKPCKYCGNTGYNTDRDQRCHPCYLLAVTINEKPPEVVARIIRDHAPAVLDELKKEDK